MNFLYQEESRAIVHCLALTKTIITLDGTTAVTVVVAAIGDGEAVVFLIERPLVSESWDFKSHMVDRRRISEIKLLNLYILQERVEDGTVTFDLLAANGKA